MSLFTFSGNKLAATMLAAGALVVGGTGVTAFAASIQDGPAALATETESPSPSPTATETESPEPSPTATETESPEPSPTATETESPEPSPSPTETDEPAPSPTSTPVGPDATGPAAFGLCNAFTHGGLNSTSTAYAALVTAAGSESNIVTYCADIPAPRDKADDESGETSTGQSGEEQVEQQRQGAAPAKQGGAGNQSGNPHTQSGGGR